jgi:hypothetical protein
MTDWKPIPRLQAKVMVQWTRLLGVNPESRVRPQDRLRVTDTIKNTAVVLRRKGIEGATWDVPDTDAIVL